MAHLLSVMTVLHVIRNRVSQEFRHFQMLQLGPSYSWGRAHHAWISSTVSRVPRSPTDIHDLVSTDFAAETSVAADQYCAPSGCATMQPLYVR